MIKQIKDVEPKVRMILERHPETRDNDRVLEIVFMSVYGGLKDRMKSCNCVWETYDVFRDVYLRMPSMASVRRARRKINERGDYRGKTWEERHKREKVVRREIHDV